MSRDTTHVHSQVQHSRIQDEMGYYDRRCIQDRMRHYDCNRIQNKVGNGLLNALITN